MEINRYSICVGCLLTVAAGVQLHVITDEDEGLEVLMCSRCDPDTEELESKE